MITLSVNGKKVSYRGHPFRRLIDFLREDIRLTGTKEGCGEGECGACTVLLDGEPVNSCLIPIGQLEGRRVDTIEAFGTPESLGRLQRLLLDEGGAQCGICTPGMVITAYAHLRRGGGVGHEDVRRALAGNLCRCTGYQHIVDAVLKAARKRRGPRKRRKP